jgi:hypothetical protein
LCPKDAGGDGKTDTYSDCPKGTEGYNAYQASIGNDSFSNEVAGAYHACLDNTVCKWGGIAVATYTGARLAMAAYGWLMAAAPTAPMLVEPERGRKLSQMIARWGGDGGREGFMSYIQDFAGQAQQLGQVVSGDVQGVQSTIYRVGNTYLRVNQATNMLISYVRDAESGWGIVSAYNNLGGH